MHVMRARVTGTGDGGRHVAFFGLVGCVLGMQGSWNGMDWNAGLFARVLCIAR